MTVGDLETDPVILHFKISNDVIGGNYWFGKTFTFLNIIFTHLKPLPNDSTADFKLIGENSDFIVTKMTEICHDKDSELYF